MPMGGGGAWQGFGMTRRAKLAARTAHGRASAHRHAKEPGPAGRTKRAGPTVPRKPVAPQATPEMGRRLRARHACLPHSKARRCPEYSWSGAAPPAFKRNAPPVGLLGGCLRAAGPGGTRNTRGVAQHPWNSGGMPRQQGRQVHAPAAR